MSTIGRLLSNHHSTDSITQNQESKPEIIAINEDAATDVFSALSSETARDILVALYNEPGVASDLADRTDTTVQNVTHHLNNLIDANLIEIADTWYSDQGRKMKVYAPVNSGLVVVGGVDVSKPTLRTALKRILGSVGLVAIVSWIILLITNRHPSPSGGSTLGLGPESAPSQPWLVAPDTLFMVAGLSLLFLLAGLWYLRTRSSTLWVTSAPVGISEGADRKRTKTRV